MSKGGERIQGSAGGPIPVGYGRGVVRGISDFSTPQHDAIKWRNYVVSGITKDSNGVALGNCNVEVYETTDAQNRIVGAAVSDASGNYSVFVNGPDTDMKFFAVAYKAGAPDVVGTTVNTLVGTEL